jgi:hypothetical protein
MPRSSAAVMGNRAYGKETSSQRAYLIHIHFHNWDISHKRPSTIQHTGIKRTRTITGHSRSKSIASTLMIKRQQLQKLRNTPGVVLVYGLYGQPCLRKRGRNRKRYYHNSRKLYTFTSAIQTSGRNDQTVTSRIS